MMLSGLLCFSIIVAVGSRQVSSQVPVADSEEALAFFYQWRQKHGKMYRSVEEHGQRYTNFLSNMKKAATLNAHQAQEQAARFGPTKFADMSPEEFRQKILMDYKKADKENEKIYKSKVRVKDSDSFDWTEKSGVVTSVKNQGSVGTCWAFAGCANVESQYGIMTGQQCPDLSPESATDCDGYSNPYNGWVACGPAGATMPAFYVWAMQEGGMMTEKDYPYCIGDSSCSPCAPEDYNEYMCGQAWPVDPCNKEDSCGAKYNTSKLVSGLNLNGFQIFSTDEGELINDLVEVGPLVAGIDATDLQLYEGGVLKPDKCSASSLNHAILLVGYDTVDDTPIWKGKNSWGTDWGEDGFFRIERGTGACGINVDVTSSLLEQS